VAHSLGEFAAALMGFEAGYLLWEHEALEHAGKIVEEEAKRVIGTYDYGWPQLAEETQQQRADLGFSANEPLLRTGDLRASISHTVDKHEHTVYIGSNSEIAVYQELGTSRIPPRSFLGGAARAKEHEIIEELRRSIYLRFLGALGIGALAKKL
jgi:hypothetical protein